MICPIEIILFRNLVPYTVIVADKIYQIKYEFTVIKKRIIKLHRILGERIRRQRVYSIAEKQQYGDCSVYRSVSCRAGAADSFRYGFQRVYVGQYDSVPIRIVFKKIFNRCIGDFQHAPRCRMGIIKDDRFLYRCFSSFRDILLCPTNTICRTQQNEYRCRNFYRPFIRHMILS